MANAATLAGHVTIEDRANIGAYSGVHQFCRVGREAYIGGYSVVVKDALPFALTVGNHARCYGLNTTGMKRSGYSREMIGSLHHAFHLLLSSKLNTSQALERIGEEDSRTAGGQRIGGFIQASKRGVTQMKYGLIAGNGKFPLLVVEGARRAGASLSVVAIREETDPEIERVAERVEWVGIGQLGKMIRFFRSEGVEQAIMAGQVKHVQIFSRAVPDARMLKMLLKLPRRNTHSLIGAVAEEFNSEGIEVIDSTWFLQHLIPQPGTLTRRAPDARESEDIEYGLEIVREIARLDLGQTMVVRGKACVAIEAMEGTDATILRAGELTRGGGVLSRIRTARWRGTVRVQEDCTWSFWRARARTCQS